MRCLDQVMHCGFSGYRDSTGPGHWRRPVERRYGQRAIPQEPDPPLPLKRANFGRDNAVSIGYSWVGTLFILDSPNGTSTLVTICSRKVRPTCESISE